MDEATGSLVIRASHGLPADLAANARRSAGEGVSGVVVQKRQPAIIAKGKSDDPQVMAVLNSDDIPLSSMAVPLIGRDKVLGVLNISKFRDPSFTTSDLQIASVLASQVVAAMENASLYEGLRESYFRTVQALVAAVEAKDPYTRWHSTNVAKYAVAVGRDLGLTPSQLEEVHIAAILHDVGKIGISERIISKPDRLSREEFDIMKDHPAHGIRILEPIGFPQPIINAIYQHHERYDGNGYPQGIAGENIALTARILSVADTIDAMVSERPYRSASSSDAVVRELEKESGLQFDPSVSTAARKLIEQGLLKLGMHTYAQYSPAANRK